MNLVAWRVKVTVGGGRFGNWGPYREDRLDAMRDLAYARFATTRDGVLSRFCELKKAVGSGRKASGVMWKKWKVKRLSRPVRKGASYC